MPMWATNVHVFNMVGVLDASLKARSITRELHRTVGAINSRGPGVAKISTMTITAKLNTSKVCRDSVAIALQLLDGDGPLAVQSAKTRKRTRSQFHNQVTMHYGSKSIKIFKNGRMHVTGCTTPLEFLDVANAVCTMVTETAGIEANDGGSVRLVDFEVHMINLNFAVGSPLHLQGLQEKCLSMGYRAVYDADTYPGLNIKMRVGDRLITALIFKSGKVIITGARTAEELDGTHRKLVKVLQA